MIRTTCSSAQSASIDHCTSGRPASSTNAFGRAPPRRSPRPAATIRAAVIARDARRVAPRARSTRAVRRPWSVREGLLALVGPRPGQLAVRRLGEKLVEVVLGLLLVLVERVHELGGEDLLGAREHLLLARR